LIRIASPTYKRRQAIEIASDVAKMAFNETTDIADTAAFIQARLDDLMHAPAQQTFQSFADLAETLPPITWLWPSWIPRGMISLLGAVPGAGKSLIALDLSRRVIHGEPFPDGSTNPYPDGRNVIYVDAELVPQLINERAKAWKVDTSKLFLMMPNPNDMIDFARQEYRERLRNMVDHLQPGLVVIDSLSSVSSKGENNIEDIRAILSFFNEIANNYQVGLLLVHHLRKRGADAPMELSPDDLRGSSHIIAMARSIMGLSVIQTTAEMDRNGPRKLEILKTNLGRYPDAIGCELLPLHPEGVYLKWDDEAPEPYKEPTLADQAATWLVEMLRDAGEPLPPKEIIELGEDEGFSRATIYRAKSMLNGQIVAVGTRPNTEWQYSL